jgi:hypothetical protein
MKIAVTGMLLAATLAAPATAYADDVPSVDQVVAIMAELTDPNIPAANKGNIVTPGFSPDEAGTIDDDLNQTNADGLLPYTFVVTDIQPAFNNFAGVTVTVAGSFNQRSAPQPIVLADQGGHWLITHDSATTTLNNFWKNANRHPAPHYLHRGPAI